MTVLRDKPGWQTSEFSVTLINLLTIALNGHLGLGLDDAEAIAIALSAIAYVLSRAVIKRVA
jgi:hypothetical protein